MPLARIITRFAEDAAPLRERLRAQGYTVETVSPDHAPDSPAELEIRVDKCALEEAIVLAAEMAPEAAAVFVGEGVIIPETQPLDAVARAEMERARQAELRRQAEAERVRLAEEASRIQREQEAERQRREAERQRRQQEAEAEQRRQEFETVRLREQAETERLRRETEAAQARAAALQELQERRRAEAAAEAQRRAEEEAAAKAKAQAEAERFAAAAAQRRAEREERARRMGEVAAAEAQAGMQPPPAERSGEVATYVSTRPDTRRPQAAVSRPPRSKTPTPKPRARGRLRQREREWRVAVVVAAVFAVLLMLGWSLAGNPRPPSPLSSSDLTKSSTIKQEVPFGPVTLPPPPATKPAAVAPPVPAQPVVKPNPPATKSTKTAKANHKSRRRVSRGASAENDGEDVVVRHFDTPQPIAHPRNSQAELRRYSDQ